MTHIYRSSGSDSRMRGGDSVSSSLHSSSHYSSIEPRAPPLFDRAYAKQLSLARRSQAPAGAPGCPPTYPPAASSTTRLSTAANSSHRHSQSTREDAAHESDMCRYEAGIRGKLSCMLQSIPILHTHIMPFFQQPAHASNSRHASTTLSASPISPIATHTGPTNGTTPSSCPTSCPTQKHSFSPLSSPAPSAAAWAPDEEANRCTGWRRFLGPRESCALYVLVAVLSAVLLLSYGGVAVRWAESHDLLPRQRPSTQTLHQTYQDVYVRWNALLASHATRAGQRVAQAWPWRASRGVHAGNQMGHTNRHSSSSSSSSSNHHTHNEKHEHHHHHHSIQPSSNESYTDAEAHSMRPGVNHSSYSDHDTASPDNALDDHRLVPDSTHASSEALGERKRGRRHDPLAAAWRACVKTELLRWPPVSSTTTTRWWRQATHRGRRWVNRTRHAVRSFARQRKGTHGDNGMGEEEGEENEQQETNEEGAVSREPHRRSSLSDASSRTSSSSSSDASSSLAAGKQTDESPGENEWQAHHHQAERSGRGVAGQSHGRRPRRVVLRKIMQKGLDFGYRVMDRLLWLPRTILLRCVYLFYSVVDVAVRAVWRAYSGVAHLVVNKQKSRNESLLREEDAVSSAAAHMVSTPLALNEEASSSSRTRLVPVALPAKRQESQRADESVEGRRTYEAAKLDSSHDESERSGVTPHKDDAEEKENNTTDANMPHQSSPRPITTAPEPTMSKKPPPSGTWFQTLRAHSFPTRTDATTSTTARETNTSVIKNELPNEGDRNAIPPHAQGEHTQEQKIQQQPRHQQGHNEGGLASKQILDKSENEKDEEQAALVGHARRGSSGDSSGDCSQAAAAAATAAAAAAAALVQEQSMHLNELRALRLDADRQRGAMLEAQQTVQATRAACQRSGRECEQRCNETMRAQMTQERAACESRLRQVQEDVAADQKHMCAVLLEEQKNVCNVQLEEQKNMYMVQLEEQKHMYEAQSKQQKHGHEQQQQLEQAAARAGAVASCPSATGTTSEEKKDHRVRRKDAHHNNNHTSAHSHSGQGNTNDETPKSDIEDDHVRLGKHTSTPADPHDTDADAPHAQSDGSTVKNMNASTPTRAESVMSHGTLARRARRTRRRRSLWSRFRPARASNSSASAPHDGAALPLRRVHSDKQDGEKDTNRITNSVLHVFGRFPRAIRRVCAAAWRHVMIWATRAAFIVLLVCLAVQRWTIDTLRQRAAMRCAEDEKDAAQEESTMTMTTTVPKRAAMTNTVSPLHHAAALSPTTRREPVDTHAFIMCERLCTVWHATMLSWHADLCVWLTQRTAGAGTERTASPHLTSSGGAMPRQKEEEEEEEEAKDDTNGNHRTRDDNTRVLQTDKSASHAQPERRLRRMDSPGRPEAVVALPHPSRETDVVNDGLHETHLSPAEWQQRLNEFKAVAWHACSALLTMYMDSMELHYLDLLDAVLHREWNRVELRRLRMRERSCHAELTVCRAQVQQYAWANQGGRAAGYDAELHRRQEEMIAALEDQVRGLREALLYSGGAVIETGRVGPAKAALHRDAARLRGRAMSDALVSPRSAAHDEQQKEQPHQRQQERKEGAAEAVYVPRMTVYRASVGEDSLGNSARSRSSVEDRWERMKRSVSATSGGGDSRNAGTHASSTRSSPRPSLVETAAAPPNLPNLPRWRSPNSVSSAQLWGNASNNDNSNSITGKSNQEDDKNKQEKTSMTKTSAELGAGVRGVGRSACVDTAAVSADARGVGASVTSDATKTQARASALSNAQGSVLCAEDARREDSNENVS